MIKNIFRGIGTAAIVCIGLSAGLWFGRADAHALPTSDLSGVKKAVTAAYQSYQTKVDVSAYHLYNTRDSESLGKIMAQVINQTPGLFYTGTQYAKSIVVETNQITTLELEYGKSFRNQDGRVNVSKIQATRAKIEKGIGKAMKCVRPGMNAVEKALVLHDYLIKNTQYDDRASKEYRYSEWGIFVKGRGNCQGYSLAYEILMERAGIPARCVSSDEMLHMWNQVKIGGKWYHVDVTWDDPLDTKCRKDQYGLALHDRFLCSTSKMKEKGYYGFHGKKANSTRYDRKFWTKVTSQIYYRKGKWLYQTERYIEQRASLTKGKAKKLYYAGGTFFTAFNRDRYYFINYNRIYLYNRKTGKIYLVMDGVKRYRSGDTVSQLKYADGKLTYRVFRGNRAKTVKKRVGKNGLLRK